MKRIFTFFLGVFVAVASYAQQPEGVIKKISEAPTIDGVMEELWDTANVYNIDKPYGTETPTLGAEGETTWRGLYNEDGMFIFLTVKDDVWFPAYIGGGDNWLFDKPEVYFDVNFELVDGQGPADPPNDGHYQVAPAAEEAKIDGTPTTQDNGVIYAFKVEDPAYTVEYFVPWSLLVDKDGNPADITRQIGFDVTIIDRDAQTPDRMRAVWANDGTVGGESWSNMDGAGLITFDGAEAPVFVDEIILTAEQNTITEDNQTLQINAEVLPEDATVKTVKWSVVPAEGSTARATISNTGLLTPIMDGVVIVSAKSMDDFIESNEIEITISGQVITADEVNVIKNGKFDNVNEDGTIPQWGGWIDSGYGGPTTVVDGVATLNVAQAHATENWHYQFNQSNLTALPNIPYIFSFVLWADSQRPVTVDFEDTEANGYNRYGVSTDPESNGRSEWSFDANTEPTRYTFHVTFDQMVPTTIQKVQYMVSLATGMVYIDSVSLISEADLALIPTSVNDISKEAFRVYPNPAVNTLTVELSAPNTRVAVYNILGVKMEEVIVPGTRHQFDVRNYKKGVYFVKTKDSVVKFIK